MIKLSIKNLISWIVTALFIAYLYVKRHEIFSTLASIKLGFFFLVLAGQLIIQTANSFILKSSLRPLAVRLTNPEAFKVTIVSSFVNFFTPVVGGASTKAVYLKSKHGLTYSAFASAFYANYMITLGISLIMGAIGVLIIPGAPDSGVAVFLETFLICGVVLIGIFVIFMHKFTAVFLRRKFKNKHLKSIVQKIELMDSGWNKIRKDKLTILEICFWSFIAVGGAIIVLWGAILSIGINTSFGSYMVFSAFATISLLFNITPGGLGVREALYASIYKITSINLSQVVAFSLVDRIAQLIVLGLGWAIFGNKMLKDLDRSKISDKEKV